MSDQAIAEALVSTMLLEGSSPRQALADFLLARKASIHQLLNQPQHGISPFVSLTAVNISVSHSIGMKLDVILEGFHVIIDP